MSLSDFAVKHPAIIGILLIMLAVFGVIAGMSMNSEMIPPVSLPAASIVTIYPGASARDVERDISRLIENQMSTLAGVSELSSSSSDSYSVVSLEFRDGVNVHEKLPQIRELLNAVEDELPDGIDGSPVIYITEASAFLPIFSVRIASDMNVEALTSYLEDRVVPAIARVSGVSRISLVGGARLEARVVLKTEELEARGISALNVYEALRYNNLNVPAGTAMYRTQQMSFTTAGAFSDFEELGNLTVGFGDGSYIYLKDIADIGPEPEPRSVRVRSGGKDYVMLDVLKRDEGDTLAIVAEARQALDDMVLETRGAVDWAVVSDQSETTQRSLNTVFSAALTGLALTILVILLVLHDLRATFIISLSIPLSILFALMGLYLTGRSLNLLSLSGMTVAIGMIVDNSIVVLENTYRHFKLSGNRRLAALKGASEVGGAVLASTTTSICVFAPLLFLTGIIGVIMNDLSLAIVFSLAASALVAVILVPWLASILLKPDAEVRKPALLRKIEGAIDRALDAIERFYRRLLDKALRNKRFTVALSVSFLVSSVLLLSILKVSFLPPTDTGEFEIGVGTPSGYSLEQTLAKVDELDTELARLVPEIETAVFYVGSSSAITITNSSNRAYGRIRLVPSRARERTIQEIIPAVQAALSSTIPDCDVTVLNGGFDALLALGTGGQGYQMEVYGSDLDDVAQTARMAREILARDPDVFKTELSVRSDDQQLYADLSQAYMGALGVTPYEAGVTGRILFGGMSAGTLREEEEDYPIRVTSDIADTRVDDDLLNRVIIRTQDGRRVSFAAFSTMESRPALSRIDRKNRNFSIEVRAYLKTEDQSGVSSRTDAAMGALAIPSGVKYRTAGTSELIGDSLSSLLFMLGIAVFLVYAVMVIQFERFMQPLIIMASIPFCLIGVVLGLYLFGSALSIISMLAIITLGGTVVNNAIVLVDYTNTLRRDLGMERRDAILEAAGNRMRPILMTALTTLFGVLPMALAHGDGSEVYAPLGQAIFGGLLTSTVITLIIIPLLYDALERRVAYIPAPLKNGAEEAHTYE
ncbi:MAG: efflux RND transporter permease subunit [Spirochaetales bacterium]|nr:efflux RND transporter permease subunit [Spirochaetales bacterium]